MTGWFDHIVGHDRVVNLLERELTSPASAYLFVGATAVGKATAARAFATALLCRNDDPTCNDCRRAMSGNHSDLVSVAPEGRATLGVDQARVVVSQAAMAPVEGGRKVFLFEEAGLMTEQAANALLKTLEESTLTTVFLLVAESEDEFPPTIASRCRTIHFGRVPEADLASALAELDGLADPEDLARVSGGRPGLAFALARQPEVAAFRSTWLSVPGRVSPRPGDGRRLAEELLETLDPMVKSAAGADDDDADRRHRAERRAELALLASGLEILASWYVDSASIQHAGPVRNTDVALADLTDVNPERAVRNADAVLDAMIDLQLNLRRELLLADLFTFLGTD